MAGPGNACFDADLWSESARRMVSQFPYNSVLRIPVPDLAWDSTVPTSRCCSVLGKSLAGVGACCRLARHILPGIQRVQQLSQTRLRLQRAADLKPLLCSGGTSAPHEVSISNRTDIC